MDEDGRIRYVNQPVGVVEAKPEQLKRFCQFHRQLVFSAQQLQHALCVWSQVQASGSAHIN